MRSCIYRVCSGEAHSNPYSDNCWTCAPHWGYFPACPDCGGKLVRERPRGLQPRDAGRCTNPECVSVRRWFDTAKYQPNGSRAWTALTLVWPEIAMHEKVGQDER